MSESVLRALDIGNKVFTSIFTFECTLKLMALSKEFFSCGWNIFDLIIVSASLLDLIFELVDGLSVLRGLRLVSRTECGATSCGALEELPLFRRSHYPS